MEDQLDNRPKRSGADKITPEMKEKGIIKYPMVYLRNRRCWVEDRFGLGQEALEKKFEERPSKFGFKKKNINFVEV